LLALLSRFAQKTADAVTGAGVGRTLGYFERFSAVLEVLGDNRDRQKERILLLKNLKKVII